MADLLGGTIDVLFVSSPVAVGQATNKNLKMLAVTSRYRLQALPNVPTVEESGVPGFDTTAWLGVMGPAGLPPTIRQKLSTALLEIARDPDTQAKLRKIGFEPLGKDAAVFQEFFRGDLKKWTEFVRDGLTAGLINRRTFLVNDTRRPVSSSVPTTKHSKGLHYTRPAISCRLHPR
jgi:tripartite-type tricarboxylate transporter receptor subunit TctC